MMKLVKNEQVEPEVENSFRFKISRTSWEKKGFLNFNDNIYIHYFVF